MPSSEGALEHRRLQLEQRRLAAKHRYMLDPSLQNGHLVLLRCQPQIARALERLRADEAGGTITRERFAHGRLMRHFSMTDVKSADAPLTALRQMVASDHYNV